MNGASLGQAVFGLALIALGLCCVLFFRRIRDFNDTLRSYDPLLRQGGWWTGKYSRGGLFVTHAAIIIVGLALLAFGVALTLNLNH